MSNTRKFAIERTAPAATQRAYVPGLSWGAALEYGAEWAHDDAAPVTLMLDEGSGRAPRAILTIRPDGTRIAA